MKQTGLNIPALAVRQAQGNPETALTSVKVRMPLPGRPAGVEFSTYQAAADARLLGILNHEQQEAMVRFHHAYRIRVGEAKMFRPPQYERIAQTTGGLSHERMLRNSKLEHQYALWAFEAQQDGFDIRPCQHIAGLGQSIREAAADIKMRRISCRDLFVKGLDRFIDIGWTLKRGRPSTSARQQVQEIWT